MICTSIGSNFEGYRAGNSNQFTVDELLRAFQQSINYVGGTYLTPYCFYRSMVATDEELATSAEQLLAHVSARADYKRDHEALVSQSMDAVVARMS